ncbi:MAG: hypothetical protein RL199_480 [Pseudomonadota bacterium]
MQDSAELSRHVLEARTIAERAGQSPSTAHLLLAFFTHDNPVERVLAARRIDEELILGRVRDLPREPAAQFDDLVSQAREVARRAGSDEVRALHLLVAMTQLRGCAAHDLLSLVVPSTAELAREALGYVVGPLPRRLQPRVVPSTPPVRTVSTPAPALRHDAPTAVPPVRPRTSMPPVRPASRVSTLEAPVAAGDVRRASRVSKIRRLAEGLEPEVQVSPFALDPEQFPYLVSLGRNLTELAAAGQLDPVIGRDREVDEALDVLGKRRANNPVLVGEPGVGKTAIVEGLALEFVRLAKEGRPPRLLVELDVAGLVAGTQLRGSLSEKLNGLKEEVRRAAGTVVVFIDEIHMLVGAGQTGEGAQDASNELKAALARGEFPCVGATTFAEFQRYFTQDPALERRFIAIVVKEPSVEEALVIVRGVGRQYARHHGVAYDEAALEAAVTLSARYVHDRALPDKALAALDVAGSRAARAGAPSVTRDEVARAVARMAKLPEDRLLQPDADRLMGLETELARRVVGHPEVVERVAKAVRRSFAGFGGQRPLASFIFLGPSGVGKTELARTLADVVFGTPDALVRVDMSEFSEGHAVAKLVGAPPGYVGFGEGGLLTEAVRRRPACVVLLDEIEKAHRDSQQLVLQLLDEGHLADGRGRRVDFTQAVVVLTSNLGAEAFDGRAGRTVGFGSSTGSADAQASRALDIAREAFPPELWNRIEERLVFRPLQRTELTQIARLLAARSARRLLEEKRIHFELDESAVEFLLDDGGVDVQLGARPMRQALVRLVEVPLAEKILRMEVQPGDRLRVVKRGARLDFDQLTVIDPRMLRSAAP